SFELSSVENKTRTWIKSQAKAESRLPIGRILLTLPSQWTSVAARGIGRRIGMSVGGTWDLSLDTPMGGQTSVLTVTSSGGTLTGTQSAQGQSADIFDGAVNGNDVGWGVSITQPMDLALSFAGTVDGDTMSGTVRLGPFGSASFRGTRA